MSSIRKTILSGLTIAALALLATSAVDGNATWGPSGNQSQYGQSGMMGDNMNMNQNPNGQSNFQSQNPNNQNQFGQGLRDRWDNRNASQNPNDQSFTQAVRERWDNRNASQNPDNSNPPRQGFRERMQAEPNTYGTRSWSSNPVKPGSCQAPNQRVQHEPYAPGQNPQNPQQPRSW